MNLIQKIARKLGAFTTRKQGEEFQFACPRCHHTKLEINPRRKLFHCFRCGYKGTLGQILKDLNIAPYQTIPVDNIEKPVQIDSQPYNIPGFKPGAIAYYPKFFMDRGIPLDSVVGKGWGISDDPSLIKGRLIIPIVEDNVIVSYVARKVSAHDTGPKEISGPNKSWFLYNLDEIKEGDDVFIVEGVFDCERLRRAGYKTVAVLGSNLSDIQAGKLLAKRPGVIYILFDGDQAGIAGALKAYDKFVGRGHVPLAIINMPEGKDPDELSNEELTRLLGKA